MNSVELDPADMSADAGHKRMGGNNHGQLDLSMVVAAPCLHLLLPPRASKRHAEVRWPATGSMGTLL